MAGPLIVFGVFYLIPPLWHTTLLCHNNYYLLITTCIVTCSNSKFWFFYEVVICYLSVNSTEYVFQNRFIFIMWRNQGSCLPAVYLLFEVHRLFHLMYCGKRGIDWNRKPVYSSNLLQDECVYVYQQ